MFVNYDIISFTQSAVQHLPIVAMFNMIFGTSEGLIVPGKTENVMCPQRSLKIMSPTAILLQLCPDVWFFATEIEGNTEENI